MTLNVLPQQQNSHSQTIWRWILGGLIAIVLVSPFFYWASGIGQKAAVLTAEIGKGLDGLPVSSPKAVALHSLALPMRIQRLLMWPILLLAIQFSGVAVGLRTMLAGQIQPWLARRFAPNLNFVNNLGDKIPSNWRKRLPGGEVIVILLFVLVLNLAIYLLYLPFNFYRSFIVGHQFDLSTLSAFTWLTDWGKAVIINLLIDGALWTGFFSLMRLMPRRWPVLGGGLLLVATMFMVVLTPIVITPLFYNVSRLEDIALRDRILVLAEHAGVPVDEVYKIDASAKTTSVNAYVTGFGGAQRIVLYDTLIGDYTPDQVEVVLAHELGHWVYRHVLLGILGLGAAAWIGLFGLRWLLHRVWQPLGLQGPDDVAGLPFILAVIAIVGMLSLPVQNGISRLAENQADAFALEVSQKPDAFMALFEQFAEQNLSLVEVPAWEKLIFNTHPSTIDRLRRAQQFKQATSQD